MSEVIAIDGPSASGKSTIARRVAQALSHIYVDSGSLYRAVTWQALRKGIATDDGRALTELVQAMDIKLEVVEGSVRFTVDAIAPGAALRTAEIDRHVSPVSAVPCVRERVVEWLRSMQRFGNLVMEGRDIGTAVFPDAAHKFYLDASPEERARRRHAERGDETAADMGAVREALKRRDSIDSTRQAAPLRVAEGAVVVDSTGLSIDDVVALILDRIGARG